MSMHFRHVLLREFTQDDPSYEGTIPANIELRAHQRVLLYRCIEMENKGICLDDDEELQSRYLTVKSNIGVLSDKTGSGKSYILLALMLVNSKPQIRYNNTYVYAHGHLALEVQSEDEFTYEPIDVLVVPKVLLVQWSGYIAAFSDKFRPYVMKTKRTVDALERVILDHNLLLVSGEMYKLLQVKLQERRTRVRRVIFDEVDTTHVPNARKMPACFYWFVSASYHNVINPYPRYVYNHADWNRSLVSSGIANNVFAKHLFATLSSTMGVYDVRCVDRLVLKNDDRFVDSSFDLESPEDHVVLCKDPAEVMVLHGVAQEAVLHSLDAGDRATALALVDSSSVMNEDNVIAIVQRNLKIKLNNIQARLRLERDQLIFHNPQTRVCRVRRLEEERDLMQSKIQLVEKRVRESLLCNICFEDLHEHTSGEDDGLVVSKHSRCVTKCCNNSFCLKCISTWIKHNPTCPICKLSMTNKRYFVVCNDENPAPSITTPMLKIDEFRKLLRDRILVHDTPKILIFSQYDNSFHHIQGVLQQLQVAYGALKGNVAHSNVVAYRTDPNFTALLINPKAYGSGLNLENTTDVVIYHKLNEQMNRQVIGRAQRPGRTSRLRIWYLFNENESLEK